MHIRRLSGVAGVVALAAVMCGTHAGADSTGAPETYHTAAAATALHLNVLGNELTLGGADVGAESAPHGMAHGVGALLPGVGPVQESTADVTADGDHAGSTTESCGPITLPESVPVLDLATACSSSVAGIDGGLPASAATGAVAHVGVNASDILGQTPLGDGADSLVDALDPIFGGLAGSGLDAKSLLSDLLDAITGSGDLVDVELGPASTSTATAAGSIQATGLAKGAVVTVLNRDLGGDVGLDPVLTIEVGAASSSAAVDRSTGVATATPDAALVRVTVAPDIAATLGDALPANPVVVAPGQQLCLPLPDPLASCINVAAGSTSDIDNGVRAESSGVSLDLLTGLPGGGITLDLAATSAEAARVAPVAATTTTVAPTTSQPEMARTGSDTPWLPLGGVFAMVAAVLGVSSRRLRVPGGTGIPSAEHPSP